MEDVTPPGDVPTLERPHWAWFAVLDGSLALLGLLALFPGLARTVRKRAPIPPQSALRAIFFAAIVVHLGEGAAAWALARKKGLNPGPWALQTTIVGFPSLLALRAQLGQNPEN